MGREGTGRGKRSFAVLASILLSLISLSAAASAAESPALSISVGADPVESITTQLGLTGTFTGPDLLQMTVKPSGGEGCGANAPADKGMELITSYGEGNRSSSRNWTFETAGAYLICAWLTDQSETPTKVVATASQTVSVRIPHLSVAIVAPARVRPKQTFQIATTAQAETSRELGEWIIPNTGRGCPANSQAAGSTSNAIQVDFPNHGQDWSIDGGPFTEAVNTHLESTGSYLVCAYFQYQSSAAVPEAATSAPILVVNPPPACVVPHLQRNTTLARAERLILAAHCKVGTIRHLASKRYRRGAVIGLSPAPGSRHANSTVVAVTVSRGRPRHHR
jgi:hypothetical protein